MSDSIREAGRKLQLIEDGHWFYPVNDFVYDEAYMDKYRDYESSEIGQDINNFRAEITLNYQNGFGILDIGIGCGTFIEAFPDGYGYDVNPVAIKYLKENCNDFGLRWVDVYEEDLSDFNVITFFDSLEHIEEPSNLLNRIQANTNVIVSIPIFKDLEHILKSKHFRPDEHYHYFTEQGFISYMKKMGFTYKETLSGEIEAGREDILTFVFTKP